MDEPKESQSSTTGPIQRPCHVCKTKTIKTCERCRYALHEIGKDHMQTYYCRKKCADNDWQRHKRDCRRATARRHLHRASFLIQYLFYATRSAAFDISIEKVEADRDSKGRLIVCKGREKKNKLVYDFPESILIDQRPGREILSWSASTMAVSRFSAMLHTCIQGTQSLRWL